jgi:hypothetical protein
MSKKNIALNRLSTIQNHLSNQPQQTGPIDLARERENASFNVKHMNWLFWGDKQFAEALVRNIIIRFCYKISCFLHLISFYIIYFHFHKE